VRHASVVRRGVAAVARHDHDPDRQTVQAVMVEHRLGEGLVELWRVEDIDDLGVAQVRVAGEEGELGLDEVHPLVDRYDDRDLGARRRCPELVDPVRRRQALQPSLQAEEGRPHVAGQHRWLREEPERQIAQQAVACQVGIELRGRHRELEHRFTTAHAQAVPFVALVGLGEFDQGDEARARQRRVEVASAHQRRRVGRAEAMQARNELDRWTVGREQLERVRLAERIPQPADQEHGLLIDRLKQIDVDRLGVNRVVGDDRRCRLRGPLHARSGDEKRSVWRSIAGCASPSTVRPCPGWR